MEESEVERIVEKTINTNRDKRIHNIWKNPEKARDVALIGFMVGLIGMMCVVVFSVENDVFDSPVLVENLLEGADCDTLKEAYKITELSYPQQYQVEKYLLAECL